LNNSARFWYQKRAEYSKIADYLSFILAIVCDFAALPADDPK
jgi:hypothetical protein